MKDLSLLLMKKKSIMMKTKVMRKKSTMSMMSMKKWKQLSMINLLIILV